MSERRVAQPEGGQKRRVSEEKWRSRWDCLIGKWIGDKTPQLGAKIRIPSVLNEIFKRGLPSQEHITNRMDVENI